MHVLASISVTACGDRSCVVNVVTDREHFSPQESSESDSGLDDSGLADSVSRPRSCARRSRSRWILTLDFDLQGRQFRLSAKLMELTLWFADFGVRTSSESCIDDTASGSYGGAVWASAGRVIVEYVERPSVLLPLGLVRAEVFDRVWSVHP